MKKRTIIELFLVGGLLIVSIWYWLQRDDELKEIETFKGRTTGVIINYEVVGAVNDYLTYEYYVENRRYEDRLIPDINFDDCEETRQCIGRKFTVYYSIKKPQLSKIDLKNELE